MDIEAYMHEVRGRLDAAAQRFEESRSATLGPIQEKIAAANDLLLLRRAELRQEKEEALSAQTEAARQRRTAASAEAARILDEAKQRAKEIREAAKDVNDQESKRVADQCAERSRSETSELEAKLAELRQQESTTRAEIGGELDEAGQHYSDEYEKVVAERLLTRKALANMGYADPPRRAKASKSSGASGKGKGH